MFAKKCLAHTQLSVKNLCAHSGKVNIISRMRRYRQLIVRIKTSQNHEFFAMAECSLKIISAS